MSVHRCCLIGWLVSADLSASSEPEVFNISSSGVVVCSVVFSGPDRGALTATQFPQLDMSLGGSRVDTERAPINYTHQPPMHYLVRVCINGHQLSLRHLMRPIFWGYICFLPAYKMFLFIFYTKKPNCKNSTHAYS